MENKEFCIFIISHGRPSNVYTVETLKKLKFTGDWFIVLDNEDEKINKYIEKYGSDKIVVFDKKKIADMTDEGNNFDNRKTTTHARNACFDIAINLGYEYFMVLDDDYTTFRWRFIDQYITFKNTGKTAGNIKSLDQVFKILLTFYKQNDFASIAIAQGGDFIGGETCGMLKNYLYNSRKCMNTFICSTKRRFWFFGQLNEDVNTYVNLGSRGLIFLTIPYVAIEQKQTQKTTGGMTDAYLKFGTYVKSFTTVLYNPSSVKVAMMGYTTNRLHHRINWRTTVPMIISEKHKKI